MNCVGLGKKMEGPDPMNAVEHIQTARTFLRDSDKEFSVGDRLQACEKLWGAASHAVMAAAQNNGWPDGSHRSLKTAVRQLADQSGDPALRGGFAAAEKFHRTFYHDFMEEFEILDDRAIVHDFVNGVLTLAGTDGTSEA